MFVYVLRLIVYKSKHHLKFWVWWLDLGCLGVIYTKIKAEPKYHDENYVVHQGTEFDIRAANVSVAVWYNLLSSSTLALPVANALSSLPRISGSVSVLCSPDCRTFTVYDLRILQINTTRHLSYTYIKYVQDVQRTVWSRDQTHVNEFSPILINICPLILSSERLIKQGLITSVDRSTLHWVSYWLGDHWPAPYQYTIYNICIRASIYYQRGLGGFM